MDPSQRAMVNGLYIVNIITINSVPLGNKRKGDWIFSPPIYSSLYLTVLLMFEAQLLGLDWTSNPIDKRPN